MPFTQSKTFALILAVVLAAFILSGCKKKEDATVTQDTTSNDVTLAGNLALPAANVAGPGAPLFAVATDYNLYCVTFTNPPIAATGAFLADGSFSVTLAAAAGKPIGCFINDAATNAPLTTLTFDTGQTSSTNATGTSSSAAMKAGKQTLTINFDPVKLSATADVKAAIDTTAVPDTSFALTDVAGAWTLSCETVSDTGNTQSEYDTCVKFLSDGTSTTALPIYLDILSATVDGNAANAMAVWASETMFKSCGSTEAMTNLGTGITGVTSTYATDPTASFATGIMQATGYDKATHSITASALQTYLKTQTATAYSYDNQSFCSTAVNPGDLDLATFNGRACLAIFINVRSETSCSLQPKPAVWGSFLQTGSAASSIAFRTDLGGATPAIGPRYAVMDLKVVGTSAIASNNMNETYTRWDDTTKTNKSCSFSEELTISFSKDATGTGATGRFTQKYTDSCESQGSSYGTFRTLWTR